jgi:Icc-related predicted phosphoesterase
VPIIAHEGRTFAATFFGRESKLESEKDLADLQNDVCYSGYYPFRTTPNAKGRLGLDRAEVDRIFSEEMVKEVKTWIQVAVETLRDLEVRCFITPGHDDRLDNDGSVVVNPERKVVMIDDNHEMVSTGYSNITPWTCPRDISEEELAKKIEDMAAEVSDMSNCIFNFHCPPYDTGLDVALKRTIRGSSSLQVPEVGSFCVPTASVRLLIRF